MPELPDITVYLEALEERIVGQRSRARPGRLAVPAAQRRAAARGELVGLRVVALRRARQAHRDRLRERAAGS